MSAERRKFIIDAIKNNEIEKQEDLVELLNNSGFKVTQATVSRDISTLGLKKEINANKKNVYVATSYLARSENEKFENLFRESVISIRCSNNIIVIRTIIGSANSAAALLDKLDFKEILGTVAGDDTIIIVIDSNEDAKKITMRLEEYL